MIIRQMSMVHDELPKYLLAPEVSALLHYVPVTPHTFRHSYAMHMLYAGIPLKVLLADEVC
ncbi:tyrosine-type recombinase/integrase [Escherichia coli]